MFESLGQFVERRWRPLLVLWGVLLVVAVTAQLGLLNRIGLPRFKEIVRDGEFAYLPKDAPSLVGEAVLSKAFPNNQSRSSVVIVVRRESAELQERDFQFIDDPDADPAAKTVTLRSELQKIQEDKSLWKELRRGDGEAVPVISRIRTYTDEAIGKLLNSQDKHASLVVVELTSEFLEWRNQATVDRIGKLLDVRNGSLAKQAPPGLDLAMSGTATVGRDMLVATRESSHATELWTVILVVLLLIAIYRAPILAMIPLITVFAARQVSLTIMTLLTMVPWLNVQAFVGLDVYMTVVLYGAGVDYCLFLIARYKEELDAGASTVHGVGLSLTRVGEAITASAATVICGIGMMIFAEFGKYQEAGIGISLALVVTLIAAMTFTPALMCWAGRKAFWPHGMSEHIPGPENSRAGTTLIGRLVVRDRFHVVWEFIGRWLVKRPGLILIVSILLMMPFAVVGTINHNHLSYGLLSELPRDKQSVVGAEAVQEHFPPGYVAPITVLVQHQELSFARGNSEGRRAVLDPIIESLNQRQEELGIEDIRHAANPFGKKHEITEIPVFRRPAVISAANRFYVSTNPELEGRLTRFEIVTSRDPFDRESITQLKRIEDAVREAVPPEERAKMAGIHLVGATASIRDLKEVTDRDQIRIDILVLVAVFIVLVILLRQISISVYLMATVFFSYLVTLGVTFVVFWALDPQGFAGLDWKVPVFVFTILIAIGQDYNIFLMTRISEEQRDHGPVEGIREALLKTGGIISSCGVIMAGTFCSLVIAGQLMGMVQLGFALAFGVMLDTFVVRPILVPAYLILINNGRLGPISYWLGAVSPRDSVPRPPDAEKAA